MLESHFGDQTARWLVVMSGFLMKLGRFSHAYLSSPGCHFDIFEI